MPAKLMAVLTLSHQLDAGAGEPSSVTVPSSSVQDGQLTETPLVALAAATSV
jgi:hypothetical protein